MDELAVRNNNLPDMVTVEVKTFIDDITFNINAIEAERRRAGKYGADQSTLESLEWQEIQLRSIKMKAQAELGKRCAEMDKTKGGDATLFRSADERETKTKAEQLAELGLTPQRAHEYEKMNKHEDLVNEYLEESIAEKKMPSQREVLNRIKEKESFIQDGEVDTEETPKSRTELGEKIVVGRNLSKRIDEIDRMMSDSNAKREYTEKDAEEEFEVIMNECMSKLRRVIEVRKETVKGSKSLKSLVNLFSLEVKRLKEEI